MHEVSCLLHDKTYMKDNCKILKIHTKRENNDEVKNKKMKRKEKRRRENVN